MLVRRQIASRASEGMAPREVALPKTYFEPENLCALAEVFREARRMLGSQDINGPTELDYVAHRILFLAAEGMSPGEILSEIRSGKAMGAIRGCADRAARKAARKRHRRQDHGENGSV
jgi:hypothetical protein